MLTYQAAKSGEVNGWSDAAEGALALVITLDQFPLNMYRNDPECFSTEFAARQVARKAIDENFDQALSEEKKAFMNMLFMHSETIADQEFAISFFEKVGLW